MNQMLTHKRLQQILNRQIPRKFGSDYLPSTLATRAEAPSISIPARLSSTRFGRDIHTLSEPETYATLLALLHPNVFEIHEQKMLSCFEDAHPLVGIPGVDTSQLPPVMGTVLVAERLNCLKWHPMVMISNQMSSGEKMLVAFPYQGDLLLFMEDQQGLYCVNWTIKADQSGFVSAPPTARNKYSASLKEKAIFRTELEEVYYADAGIRTVRVAGNEIDKTLKSNLKRIWPLANRNVELAQEQKDDVTRQIKIAFEKEIPVQEVFLLLARKRKCSLEDALTVFYEAIWNRKIKVDWFKPILPDYPLKPQKIDPLEKYHNWFLR